MPTSMTWLGLSVALRDAGADLSLVGIRHAARLRGAISGKHKSDVIDADVLATDSEVFSLSRLCPPDPDQLALRRACTRRGALVIDGNRAGRRLISLARSAVEHPARLRRSSSHNFEVHGSIPSNFVEVSSSRR